MVLSGRVPTCDNARSWWLCSAAQLGHQASCQHDDPISHSITLSMHWANYSLCYPYKCRLVLLRESFYPRTSPLQLFIYSVFVIHINLGSKKLALERIAFNGNRLDEKAKWVPYSSPILGDWESIWTWVWTLVKSTQWLKYLYLLLPSQALCIIRIGLELVGSVSEWDIRSWCWQPGLLVGQHYKVSMGAHCHKSVPVLIWP